MMLALTLLFAINLYRHVKREGYLIERWQLAQFACGTPSDRS